MLLDVIDIETTDGHTRDVFTDDLHSTTDDVFTGADGFAGGVFYEADGFADGTRDPDRHAKFDI